MSKQAILDKLDALEHSVLQGRNALSLGGVAEQGVHKMLDRLATHLQEVTDMVASLPSPPVPSETAVVDLFKLPSDVPWTLCRASEVIATGKGIDSLREKIDETYGTRSVRGKSIGLHAMVFREMDSRSVIEFWVFDSESEMMAREVLRKNARSGMDSDLASADHYLRSNPEESPSVSRAAADAFLDFFRDRGEALFAAFGMEAVDLFNAAQAERRVGAVPLLETTAQIVRKRSEPATTGHGP